MSLIRTQPGSNPRRPDRDEAPAPRQEVIYRCPRDHEFTVTFAAGVVPPVTWEWCRCGAEGNRDQASQVPDLRAAEHARHVAHVFSRRTQAELETILAEALAEMRAGRRIGELAPAAGASPRKRGRRAA